MEQTSVQLREPVVYTHRSPPALHAVLSAAPAACLLYCRHTQSHRKTHKKRVKLFFIPFLFLWTHILAPQGLYSHTKGRAVDGGARRGPIETVGGGRHSCSGELASGTNKSRSDVL